MGRPAKKKMTRSVPRAKFFDEKYLGSEPTGARDNLEMIKALNWYNYFYEAEDAKNFILTFMKEGGADKKAIKKFNQLDANAIKTHGWVIRMHMNGSELPPGVLVKSLATINDMIKAVPDEPLFSKPNAIQFPSRKIDRSSNFIGELEEIVDNFVATGEEPNLVEFFRSNDIKPPVAQAVVNHYKPLYSELFDAVHGDNKELKEAYSCYKKTFLKKFLEFVKNIIFSAESRIQNLKIVRTRKPRVKKEKPVSKLISKLRYLEKDDNLNLTSIKPTEIIGAQQLWVFNTKYRNLTVYNAMGPSGFGVKGTTLQNFDEKTSVTKKLRKPDEQLKKMMESGKVSLRKYMDEIKTTESKATGRINSDTILLRVFK